MPELARLITPILRADYEVFETYRHCPGAPLPVPTTVLAGTNDPEVTSAEMTAWRDLTAEDPEFHIFPGGHFFLSDHLKSAVSAVVARLRQPTL
ncbi:thioesterase II family protein [Amycolatopsis sp. lyj-108]|uniref:thioesterase II family protein n=1 Tax=Amycolatopsis sp. lyj-108 TaxID=2789286 RepID=UPI00397A0CC7